MINKKFDWYIRTIFILGLWLIIIVLVGIFTQPQLSQDNNNEYYRSIQQERQAQSDALSYEFFNKLRQELSK